MLKSGRQTMAINSAPSGIDVYREDQLVGTTPCTYEYDPEHGSIVELRLSDENHETTKLELNPKVSSKVAFANAMLFHLPMLFTKKDAVELYDLGIDEVTVGMVPKIPEVNEDYNFPIVEIIVNSSALKGTIDKRKIIKADREALMREFDTESYRATAFRRGAQNSYVQARFIRSNNTGSKEFLEKSTFKVKVSIEHIDVNIKESRKRVTGTAQMKIRWKFLDCKTDEEKFELTTDLLHNAISSRKSRVLVEAAQRSMRQLLAQEELLEYLSEMKVEALEASKGELMNLDASSVIQFNDRDDMIENLIRAVATVRTSDGHGSAFLIDNNGHFLTNYHVIEGASSIKVILDQGLELDGKVVKQNPNMDLALLHVENITMPCLVLGNENDIKLGQEVFAIGTPVDEQLGQTVSKGILSGKRKIEEYQFLQTDVSINPGNSGGPLISSKGLVIGINTLKISGGGLEGLGFAVPITLALEMLNLEISD